MPTVLDSPPTPTRAARRRPHRRRAAVAVLLAAVLLAAVAAVLVATSTATTSPPRGRDGSGGGGGGAGPVTAAGLLSQADAADRLERAGITVSSTDGCDDRDNPQCTSLDGIRPETIDLVVDLAATTGCELTVTGGTETGHAAGPHSHGTGYKVDLATSTCLDQYVADSFTSIGVRDDGYPQWQSPFGNLYCDEISHWDVTALADTGTT